MTIFITVFRFFVFTILLIGGPKFHQFGPIVTQMNGADPGSPKITLSSQTMKFLIKIFETQSGVRGGGYLAKHPLYTQKSNKRNTQSINNEYTNHKSYSSSSFQLLFYGFPFLLRFYRLQILDFTFITIASYHNT